MKRIIGITGGIASGKTTVSQYIKSLGYKVFDCDEIAHNVFERANIQEELKKAFNLNKRVERSDISKLVFSDKEKKEVLNKIMKDAILKEMDNIIKHEDQTIFFDTPLLYDWSLEDMFDKIIFVYSSYDMQLKRLQKRDNIDEAYAKEKISSQMDMDIKLIHAKKRCDIIIENDCNEASLYKKVDVVLKELAYDF